MGMRHSKSNSGNQQKNNKHINQHGTPKFKSGCSALEVKQVFESAGPGAECAAAEFTFAVFRHIAGRIGAFFHFKKFFCFGNFGVFFDCRPFAVFGNRFAAFFFNPFRRH